MTIPARGWSSILSRSRLALSSPAPAHLWGDHSAPELRLKGVQTTANSTLVVSVMFACAVGLFLTVKSFGKESQ